MNSVNLVSFQRRKSICLKERYVFYLTQNQK